MDPERDYFAEAMEIIHGRSAMPVQREHLSALYAALWFALSGPETARFVDRRLRDVGARLLGLEIGGSNGAPDRPAV